MKKIIKVYIVMNENEENGHQGILWFTKTDGLIQPLQVYAEEQDAETMAKKAYSPKKVIEAEIIINH